MGSPGNVCGPVVAIRVRRREEPGTLNLQARPRAVRRGGSEDRTNGWYWLARATEPSRTEGRRRSVLMVPTKRGNATRADPVEGNGTPE